MPLTPRYVCEPRTSWEPPRYVVVDTVTGSLASRHETEVAAKAATEGLNARPPQTT